MMKPRKTCIWERCRRIGEPGGYGQDIVYVFLAVPNVTFMQPMVSIVPADEVWWCLTN